MIIWITSQGTIWKKDILVFYPLIDLDKVEIIYKNILSWNIESSTSLYDQQHRSSATKSASNFIPWIRPYPSVGSRFRNCGEGIFMSLTTINISVVSGCKSVETSSIRATSSSLSLNLCVLFYANISVFCFMPNCVGCKSPFSPTLCHFWYSLGLHSTLLSFYLSMFYLLLYPQPSTLI